MQFPNLSHKINPICADMLLKSIDQSFLFQLLFIEVSQVLISTGLLSSSSLLLLLLLLCLIVIIIICFYDSLGISLFGYFLISNLEKKKIFVQNIQTINTISINRSNSVK